MRTTVKCFRDSQVIRLFQIAELEAKAAAGATLAPAQVEKIAKKQELVRDMSHIFIDIYRPQLLLLVPTSKGPNDVVLQRTWKVHAVKILHV